MVGSMRRKGNCYDNARIESSFGTFKTELTFHGDYAPRNEAGLDIFEYIEVFLQSLSEKHLGNIAVIFWSSGISEERRFSFTS